MTKRGIFYICKRAGESVVSLLVLSFVVFSLLYLAPGDPARVLIGIHRPNPEVIEAIRSKYHLDEPFFSQYLHWLYGAVKIDFGESIRSGAPVVQTALPYINITLQLIAMAMLLSIPSGVFLGVASAKMRGKFIDKAINIAALTGSSAPSFALAFVFLYVFALGMGLFPVYGIGDGGFADALYHLILPAITLSIMISALLIKISRSCMLIELKKDYGLFQKARGVLPWKTAVAELRNASGPILTSTGLLLANTFASIILIESAFAIPGVGSLIASSVTFKDVPMVQFLTLAVSFFICVTSAVIDVCIYFANPQLVAKLEKSMR
ncbi:MAG: ABC transporter permease [Spirochaetaceae bacterium]|jgi:peptide/nickel transport system permease protein|nr:ABC transporter permease [Spirochaetaceae bacterium]